MPILSGSAFGRRSPLRSAGISVTPAAGGKDHVDHCDDNQMGGEPDRVVIAPSYSGLRLFETFVAIAGDFPQRTTGSGAGILQNSLWLNRRYEQF